MRSKQFLTVLTCAIATACLAADYSYKCRTPACPFAEVPTLGQPVFKPHLEIGFFDYEGHISGYCCACKSFVTLRWKNALVPKDVSTNLPYVPPQKLGTVWMPSESRELNLYPCPECKTPFIEIEESRIQEKEGRKIIFCPKCSKQSLELWQVLKFP